MYVQRAQMWEKLGNYQNAIDDLTRAIDLDSEKASYCLSSENSSYYEQRAMVYEKLGSKDLAKTDKAIAERISLGSVVQVLIVPPF